MKFLLGNIELRVWSLNWVCGGEALEGVIWYSGSAKSCMATKPNRRPTGQAQDKYFWVTVTPPNTLQLWQTCIQAHGILS